MTDETADELTGAISRTFCKRGDASSRIGVDESTESKATLGYAFELVQTARRMGSETSRQSVMTDTIASEVVSK